MVSATAVVVKVMYFGRLWYSPAVRFEVVADLDSNNHR
jgi:hypothetical protein